MAFKAACIQMTSSGDIAANLNETERLVREAAAQGATLIATPENTCHMVMPATDKLKSALPEDAHTALPRFSALASELGVWILIGSVAIKISETKLSNRSYLFSPDGRVAAQYNKIHLFDVQLPTGEVHRESALIEPGEAAVVADTPLGKIGLSICYDVRFAALYRKLAQQGAQILAIPAAFTVPTGQAHWEVLLRARAIETGSYVIAPAQVGEHMGGRRTYGHSMIISPWGEIIAEAKAGPEIIYGDIDLKAVEQARTAIPALRHDRIIL